MPQVLARLPNDRQVPLLGGTYQARSVIAEAQRCVNLYPEINPQDAEAQTTHYPVPGLVLKDQPSVGGRARGLYKTSTGQLFAVIGQNVFYISPTLHFQLLGALSAFSSNPVGMTDNGTALFIVDGSRFGYQVDLSSLVVSAITDPNFLGADRIDYLSTFLVSNIPATQEFQSTHAGSPPVWDGLYVASKTGFPDLLQTLIVMHLEIWLLGSQTTEIWYNAGGATFPFALFQGAYVEHGIAAKYSVQKHDLAIFWLSKDKDGQSMVLKGENYRASRISTHAIEVAFNSYSRIDDAVGDIYQIDGHIFYRLHFPTADKTWVYDVRTELWHEIESLDAQGTPHRARDCFATYAYGGNFSLDWQTGALYQLSTTVYDDAGSVRVYRRGFPHLVSNGARCTYASFAADMDCGNAAAGSNAQAFLRWSDDRGKTWNNPMPQPTGTIGQTFVQPKWWRLGLARDRVFELFWDSTAQPTALNGAWIDAMPMVS